MSITDRVRKLRQQSLDAKETLSSERAELVTEFYKAQALSPYVSVPVQRAMAFAYLMEHKNVTIGEGELIVGEKGPAPKMAPTYPELCCHSLDDLDILDSRPKTSFKIGPETRRVYEKTVIPFWQGKSLRDL
ncbi:MAG: pyruvate formate lyase family protein, partial [Anaerolineales bacterium]